MNHTTTLDYIVVGAGSAGCVVASRLSEDPALSVGLLEAGGKDSHPLIRMPLGFLQALRNPRFTWGYESEPEPHLNRRVLPVPRGRLWGGSSSINGMFHIRGHRKDFDDWRDAGCTGWGYADVLPYFRRSETHWRGDTAYHGGQGPLQVNPIDTRQLVFEPLRESAAQLGHQWVDDYDGPDNEGFARGDVAIDRRGRRSSTARAYLHPALGRPNLTLLSPAKARRVLLRDGRAIGVEYEQNGQIRQVFARREVILCGGSYNSPHLLMLSGIGDADTLRQAGVAVARHLPGVGRNLIEHPLFGLHFKARHPNTFTNELRLDRALLSILRWAATGKGPFANQVCTGTILLKSAPGLDRPDIQLLCSPVQIDAHLWFPGLVKPKPHGFLVNVSQLYIKSRGRVSLRSPDPGDKPRIDLNLFSHPDDFGNLIQGIRAARALFSTGPQAGHIAGESIPGPQCQTDAQLEQAIREQCGITHHPVGTCAMGVGDQAVVDPELKVHGIEGLRVADASIMPAIVGANTNAATIMIGEKAADLILGKSLPATPI